MSSVKVSFHTQCIIYFAGHVGDVMDINDIPSELLLHIFSYLPQRDLLITIDKVCQYWRHLCLSPPLWKNINYSTTNGEFSDAHEHLLQIQSYVRKLTKCRFSLFGSRRKIKLQFLNLKTLDVFADKVSSGDFFDKIIQRCPNLENIKFSADYDSTNMEVIFSKLSDLQLIMMDITFYISRTIDENLISLLKKEPRVKKLTLCGWAKNASITISNILDYLPNITSFSAYYILFSNGTFTRSNIILNLKELDLRCHSIDDEGLQHVTRFAKQLKVLNIEECSKMTDKALYYISQNCPLLEKLSFGMWVSHANFSNHGLFYIADRSLKLKYLSTISCKNIDDDGVISLVESCHGLTYISLKGCTEITDNSLNAIGEHCLLLREAKFERCCSISARGVYCLTRSCRGLNYLNLSFCTGISDDNIDDVKENQQPEMKDHQREFKDQQTETKGQQTETKGQQIQTKDHQPEMKDHQTEMKDQHTETKDVQLISNFAIHSHLKELNLRSCTDISKETVLRFTDICPDLRKINLSGCINNNGDDDFIVRVFDDCQFLKKFEVYQRIVHRKNYNRKS